MTADRRLAMPPVLRRGLALLGVVVAILCGVAIVVPSLRNEVLNAWLESYGIPATGVVVSVGQSEHVVNHQHLARVVVDVQQREGGTLRTVADQQLAGYLAPRIVPGAIVSVTYRAADPLKVLIVAVR